MPTPKSPVVEGLKAKEIVIAKGHPEYQELPALVSEDRRRIVTSRWELSAADRKAIAAGADVFVSQMTFGGKLQPLLLSVASKDMPVAVASSIFGVSVPVIVKKDPAKMKQYVCVACGAHFKALPEESVCPECTCRTVELFKEKGNEAPSGSATA